MHSVIVSRNNEVIVQRENDCYTDTMANFLRDGGELPPGGWGAAWNGAAVWFAGNLE